MCAIIGFHTREKRREQTPLLAALWRESRVRGLHAYGAAWLQNGAICCKKLHELAGIIAGVPTEAKTMIGHCRYSTSGDWREEANNQPIERPGLALVFNGVVHMGTREEMARDTGLPMETENDGEIVARWIEGATDYRKRLADAGATYAGLNLTKEGATVFRNEARPAWLCRTEGAVFIGSTADIFRRAGFEGAEPVPANEPIRLDELLG